MPVSIFSPYETDGFHFVFWILALKNQPLSNEEAHVGCPTERLKNKHQIASQEINSFCK